MDERKNNLVKEWLLKAMDDFGSAQVLAESSFPYYGTALYHCQQGVEKAFKAFLLFNDIEFEKTHNLGTLLDLCVDVDHAFSVFSEEASALTPYATAYRYPAEIFAIEPTKEDMDAALAATKHIIKFIFDVLPNDVIPAREL